MGLYFEDFEVGRQFPTYGRTITEGDLSLFCSFAVVLGVLLEVFLTSSWAFFGFL